MRTVISHFDENTKTIDAYVTRIRHVATLLGYREPQILEVFKNTLLTKLYWILFSIEDLRQAVETAKRILTKEMFDEQLTGQTSTSPFMSIREEANRKVSFDTRGELGDKIDKLTVMLGRLAAKDNNAKRPFKPQIYQSRGRGQNRGCGQRNYQNRNIIGQVVEIEDSLEVDPHLSRTTEGTIFETMLENMEDKIAKGNIEMIIIDVMVTIEVGIDQERGHSQEVIAVIELGVQAVVGLGQYPEPVLIGIE